LKNICAVYDKFKNRMGNYTQYKLFGNTNYWLIKLNPASVAGKLFVLIGLVGTMGSRTMAQNPLSPIGKFNVFVQNDLTLINNETEGSVAVGGNLTVNSGYKIAGTLRNTPVYTINGVPIGLVVNGGVKLNNNLQIGNNTYVKIGNCAGNGSTTDALTTWYKDNNNNYSPIRINKSPDPNQYGSGSAILLDAKANTWSPEVSAGNNPVCASTGIDFTGIFSQLKTTSQSLASCSHNAQITNSGGTPISNTGLPGQIKINLQTGVNVFNVTGEDLNNLTEFILNNQPSADKILIVNVAAPGTFAWKVPNINLPSGSAGSSFILWNFSSTTQLNIEGGGMIEGSVLAPNADVIKTQNFATIEGQMVAKSFIHGGGEMHDYTFNAEVAPCTAMPVRLTQFSVNPAGNAVQIVWETTWEQNSAFFSVERSTNVLEFATIGRVNAKGETTKTQQYALLDEQPLPQTAYYRLRMADKDGSFTYSKPVAYLPESDRPLLKLLENPVQNRQLRVLFRHWTVADLHLTNSLGQAISLKITPEANGTVALQLEQSLTTGVYFLMAGQGVLRQWVRV
jgi:choice-of-anchor A domain-containing protein